MYLLTINEKDLLYFYFEFRILILVFIIIICIIRDSNIFNAKGLFFLLKTFSKQETDVCSEKEPVF